MEFSGRYEGNMLKGWEAQAQAQAQIQVQLYFCLAPAAVSTMATPNKNCNPT